MAAAEGAAPPAAVVWSGPLFNRTGWAEEARNAILALDRAGIAVRVNPLMHVPWQTRLAAGIDARLEQLVTHERPNGRVVHVMHFSPRAYARHRDADCHVGRPMWEFETPPAAWIAGCNLVDEVWVPSDFNIEAFARAGVAREKLHKVPEALQAELYDLHVPPLELPEASGFVFLSVFGWIRRKGWDVLVRAYLEEFRADEGVTLVLKLSPYFGMLVPEMVARLDAFVRGELGRDPLRSAPIVVLDFDPGADGMARLYRAADAFVLPTRGEGWGRPYMEAMAMGLPTIGTRWSGNLEFMTDENAYLIDCTVTDVSAAACEELPSLRGHRWAEPSVEHLRALMRRVFARRQEAAAKGARARADVLAHCSWDALAEVLVGRLEALGLPRRGRAPGAPRVASEAP